MGTMRRRPIGVFAVVAVAVSTALAACGDPDDERPSTASWTLLWEERQELIPDATAITSGGEDLCGERLGALRTELPELRPAPSEALDSALEDWISLAETVMFECPSDPAELDEQLDTLDALAAEVDAGIDAVDG